MGWWSKGKHHGLGVYYADEIATKYGLWEFGNNFKWFNQETVS